MSRNGRTPLHVEVRGNGGEPLVLVHGFGASSVTWRFWVDELARKHTVYLVDLKGFGQARKPRDGRYSPIDQARHLIQLLDDHGLSGVTLVGHSLGGAVVMVAAVLLLDRKPGQLRRLVAISGSIYPQKLSWYVSLCRIPVLSRLALAAVPSRYLIRKVLEEAYHDPDRITDDTVELYARPLRSPDVRYALVETALDIIPRGADDITVRYPEIRTPSLLLWGAHDHIVPPSIGRRALEDLPRAELTVLDDCGHVPPEEVPGASLDAFLDFMDRTGEE